jgi:hypothetical protein
MTYEEHLKLIDAAISAASNLCTIYPGNFLFVPMMTDLTDTSFTQQDKNNIVLDRALESAWLQVKNLFLEKLHEDLKTRMVYLVREQLAEAECAKSQTK